MTEPPKLLQSCARWQVFANGQKVSISSCEINNKS